MWEQRKTVTALKQEFPELMTIIVSGYQEFEYVQGAIKAGASDYILKPVVPADMQKTLERVAVKLKHNYYYKIISVIHGLCNGEAFGEETIRQYFPHQSYCGAIIRRNGLPKRFGGANNLEIYSDINEMITVYGRDEMEVLYLIPQEMLLDETFEAYLDNRKELLRSVLFQPYLPFLHREMSVGIFRGIVKGAQKGKQKADPLPI